MAKGDHLVVRRSATFITVLTSATATSRTTSVRLAKRWPQPFGKLRWPRSQKMAPLLSGSIKDVSIQKKRRGAHSIGWARAHTTWPSTTASISRPGARQGGA